jgi:hypothetical protein
MRSAIVPAARTKRPSRPRRRSSWDRTVLGGDNGKSGESRLALILRKLSVGSDVSEQQRWHLSGYVQHGERSQDRRIHCPIPLRLFALA